MKTNRKVVRSVICVLLALIFVVSLMTALIPVNASAASQSEINQLTQQRKELQAKQKEQQKTISNLRTKKASIVEQKAALDQEMNLAQQEIEVVKEQITAYDQQIEDCEDGGLILTLTTRSEPELRAWVRSFGDAAVLLEDDTPREQG